MPVVPSDFLMPQFTACIAAETEPVEAVLTRRPAVEMEAFPVPALSPAQLRRVVLFIESHLDEDLPLTALAAVADLSPSHFARRFKAATGQAPHRYVLARRVNGAKRLLLETDMPLAEVAAATGFSSQAHLTGIFGRAVGMTPGAYRVCRNECLDELRAGGGKGESVAA